MRLSRIIGTAALVGGALFLTSRPTVNSEVEHTVIQENNTYQNEVKPPERFTPFELKYYNPEQELLDFENTLYLEKFKHYRTECETVAEGDYSSTMLMPGEAVSCEYDFMSGIYGIKVDTRTNWAQLGQYDIEGKFYPEIKSKVITGKKGWRTPTGSFYINTVEVNPKWYIPNSIMEETYSDPEELTEFLEGVDDCTYREVRWDNTRYYQPAGPKNPLGEYKLSIRGTRSGGYAFHGTNAPRLFRRNDAYRCLSHGCIRTELIELVAEYVLDNVSHTPSMTKEEIHALVHPKDPAPATRKPGELECPEESYESQKFTLDEPVLVEITRSKRPPRKKKPKTSKKGNKKKK